MWYGGGDGAFELSDCVEEGERPVVDVGEDGWNVLESLGAAWCVFETSERVSNARVEAAWHFHSLFVSAFLRGSNDRHPTYHPIPSIALTSPLLSPISNPPNDMSALNSVVNKLVRAAASVSTEISDADLDAHVARILAEEAKANDNKWSELGLGAYLNREQGRDS